MKESAIEFQMLVWLNQNKWFAWKNQSQGTYDTTQESYRKGSVFQINGVSDIIAIHKTGQVIFVEAKASWGKQSKAQMVFESQILLHGGVYILARSLEELQNEVHRLLPNTCWPTTTANTKSEE